MTDHINDKDKSLPRPDNETLDAHFTSLEERNYDDSWIPTPTLEELGIAPDMQLLENSGFPTDLDCDYPSSIMKEFPRGELGKFIRTPKRRSYIQGGVGLRDCYGMNTNR
jgi:hypothetical protein